MEQVRHKLEELGFKEEKSQDNYFRFYNDYSKILLLEEKMIIFSKEGHVVYEGLIPTVDFLVEIIKLVL